MSEYPYVYADGTVLDDRDLIRIVGEKCGDGLAQLLQDRLFGHYDDEPTIKDLIDQIRDCRDVLDSMETSLGDVQSVLENIKAHLPARGVLV